MRRGNCYVASEALYHLLGGKDAGWTPIRMKVGRETHWFLWHDSGLIVDVTRKQFTKKIDYEYGRGSGFMTKRPSRRAKKLMKAILWQ